MSPDDLYDCVDACRPVIAKLHDELGKVIMAEFSKGPFHPKNHLFIFTSVFDLLFVQLCHSYLPLDDALRLTDQARDLSKETLVHFYAHWEREENE